MEPKAFKISVLTYILFFLTPFLGNAQTCPSNIGFEMGTFANWECYSGKINTDGSLSLTLGAPVPNVHTINQNTYPQQTDTYGGFPINCPNGSKYSIRLGNASSGAGAERVSYTFTIPAGQNDYSIIYNYAVVFQNPDHQDYQQPRFTSQVYDVTSGQYLGCGSFAFVASSGIDGFQLSPQGGNIYYKPWSPITVKLFGLAGRTIRLEFTNNDCSPGGHFGYAYLDVNENCTSPISGNTYCNGANNIKLTAPFGFAGYSWYTADFSQLLGTSNVLTINPPPPPNTTYALIITPHPGLGCLDTLRTTIHLSADAFNFVLKDTATSCIGTPADITASSLTLGSTPGLTFSYFSDQDGLNYVPTPDHVDAPGIYYVKGVNLATCNDIKPVLVLFKPAPNLLVNNPPPVCVPNTVDVTGASITAGSEPGLSYSYSKDLNGLIPLPNPNAINIGGTYYIKGVSVALGCSNTMPVNVVINEVPDFNVKNPSGCESVDLTAFNVTQSNLSFTYWQDAAATLPFTTPTQVANSGLYYIQATSAAGCVSATKPLSVSVNHAPPLTVTHPLPVDYPVKIDITTAFTHLQGVVYTYWKDSAATRALGQPTKIDTTGIYYIKATSIFGCSNTQPVKVVIIPPPDPTFTIPTAFSPNKDGINDVLRITTVGFVDVKRFMIFNRWGQVVYETKDLYSSWDGAQKGQPLPMGVYYWTIEAADIYNRKGIIKNGSVTLIR